MTVSQIEKTFQSVSAGIELALSNMTLHSPAYLKTLAQIRSAGAQIESLNVRYSPSIFDARIFASVVHIPELGSQLTKAVTDFGRWSQTSTHWQDESMRLTQMLLEMSIKSRWPVPGHLPASTCNRIVRAYEKGELSDDDLDYLFVKLHPPESMDQFKQRWGRYEWLGKRTPIVLEALTCYANETHYAVVSLLLTQIEGVLYDAVGGKIDYRRGDHEVLFKKASFAVATRDFWLNVVREQGKADGYIDTINQLGRHTVLHGIGTDYGTAVHSLRLILLADNIFGSLDLHYLRKEELAA